MAQHLKVLNPNTSLHAFFGAELRRLREKAGLSLGELATLVPYSRSLLFLVERADRYPDERLALLCDRALSTDDHLHRLWPHVERERHAADMFQPGAGHEEGDEMIERRRLLGVSVAGAGSLGLNPAMGASDNARGVSPAVVSYFDSQLHSHYDADNVLGSASLIPTVTHELALVSRFASEAASGLRRPLQVLASIYAELLGWLYQDLGRLLEADRLRDQALQFAYQANDRQLVASALIDKAWVRCDAEDAVSARELAQAALDQPGIAAKPAVLAWARLAHAHAMLGDADACDAALGEAERLRAQVDDDFVWGNCCRSAAYIPVQRATCDLRLGRAQRAAQEWEEIIGDDPDDYQRDTGVYLARQGTALAIAGRPDQAAATGLRALRSVVHTGSRRAAWELDRLDRELEHFPEVAEVRDFQEARRSTSV